MSKRQRAQQSTYGDQIKKNLNNLASVAVLHPRLAIVGVESELESVFLETMPQVLLKEWIETYNTSGHDFPVTSAIRKELSIGYRNHHRFPDRLGTFIDSLRKRAGASRHSREGATIPDALTMIADANEFIDLLREGGYSDTFVCDDDGWKAHYHLSTFFNASSGSTFDITCARCRHHLHTFQVPFADESPLRHLAARQQDDVTSLPAILADTIEALFQYHTSSRISHTLSQRDRQRRLATAVKELRNLLSQ